jgi:hypothetical protein
MMNENDRLPLDKPQPMKPTEWILLGILVLLLALTFPFLWWMYRPLIWILFRFALPLAVVVFIGYFAIRALQLGEPTQGDGTFARNLAKVWDEFVLLIRKYFKTVAITVIVATLVFVGSAITYTKLSKKSVTEKQLARMSQSLAKHKDQLGSYPADLAGLVGNDPLKREWYQDSWGNSIEYSITKNGAGYQLISPGADGVKGNGDDVIVSI